MPCFQCQDPVLPPGMHCARTKLGARELYSEFSCFGKFYCLVEKICRVNRIHNKGHNLLHKLLANVHICILHCGRSQLTAHSPTQQQSRDSFQCLAGVWKAHQHPKISGVKGQCEGTHPSRIRASSEQRRYATLATRDFLVSNRAQGWQVRSASGQGCLIPASW